jgi:MoCo/4Fe-4S cofactor protein with predicted Tat translocation signal
VTHNKQIALPMWRSLDEHAGKPSPFREGEFPVGADLPPDGVSRRDFMTLLGATAALAGAACRRPVEHIVPYVDAPEQVVPGIPRTYATTMPNGTSAYGLLVESHEGRPTKIEGNELHPSTLGSSSARVQAQMLDLYDPDRSRAVLRKGEKASWTDFVTGWAEIAKAHAADQGAGLAVVCEPYASPTQHRLVTSLRQRYPQARVLAWDPAGDENAHEGLTRATGRALLPQLHLDRARVVLALDADLLLSDPEMIRHNRGFAASRRVSSGHDPMSRLYAVEGVHTITGGNADHRIRLSSRLVPAFLAALASEMSRRGLGVTAPDATLPSGVDAKVAQALVSDLLANRGTSVIAAGRRQPAAVHAAVAALNAALGNVGATVTYHEPTDALLPARGELAALVQALGAGQVKTLVLLNVNPGYAAPADLAFGDAAKKAAEIVHLGTAVDETAAFATWHLPATHFLEAWGDVRALGGTLSVVQPLIQPLHGGKSAIEVLGLLASGAEKPGYDLVRETWQNPADWNRVLHDGLRPGSEVPPVAVAANPAALEQLANEARALGSGASGLELVFQPCAKLHDGRNANNAWLQELPDPVTKVVWDNPLLMSPGTAQTLGVEDDDVVRVDAAGRSLELPVFRVPGMADGTLVATLGYGRRAAGRVGDGVGANAFLLRTAASPDLVVGVTATATGRDTHVVQTQEHGAMEDRPIYRQGTLAQYKAKPDFHRVHADEQELFSLWKEHEYSDSPQWAMTIDLNACTGCNACAVACQSENNIPAVGKDQVDRGREMAWIRVDRYFTGDPAEAGAVFQPVPCMHCENAPCEQVCPVAATVHDHEGLNVMVYNRCIGTRYCSNNCPYKVRRFNFFNFTKDTPETVKLAQNPDVTVRARGVMEKCTFCLQRLSRAKIDAKLAGRDPKTVQARTACQQACPAQAITFGNLADPKSDIVKAKQDPRGYSLLGELNSKPRTTYMARVRNPHPDLAPAAPAGATGHHG